MAKKRINSRSKGSDFELKIAKKLSTWWGEDFHRTPMSGGLGWSKDSRVSGDIVVPSDSLFPYSIECKKREEWTLEQFLKGKGEIDDWWNQCARDGKKVEKIPLLIFSKNFDEIYCMLPFSDFNLLWTRTSLFENASYFIVNTSGKCKECRVIFFLKDLLEHTSKEEVINAYVRI